MVLPPMVVNAMGLERGEPVRVSMTRDGALRIERLDASLAPYIGVFTGVYAAATATAEPRDAWE